MKVVNKVLIKVYDSDISADGKFIVPDNVARIGSSAFAGCKSLKKIVIPNNVTEIGSYAFCRCQSLKEVLISDSVTAIKYSAFDRCNSLEKLVIPNSVTEIGSYVFCGCTALKDISIPNSITTISDFAFLECKSLQEITIPDSVTTIGYHTFDGCKSLKKVIIPGSVTKIGHYAFRECNALKEISIPDSVTAIERYTFNDCQSLTTIHWDGIYSVRCVDGYCMHILTSKNWNEYIVFRCKYFPSNSNKIIYVVEKDGISAHGSTIREAIADWQFKCMENIDLSKHIARIAQQGYMDANDYRLLTGACRQGTDHFLQEHHLTWEDTMPVEEVLKLTEGFYGFEKFRDTAKKILSL